MILSLSSLSADDAKWWLGASNALLMLSAVVLVIGLGGEWSGSDSWKKRIWYNLAKAAVILGVVGELLGDAGIFETSARLQALEEGAISDADTKASDAIKRAADLDIRAAVLNKEAADLRAALDKERAKTSVRPWTKEQFDALQDIKGIVSDVGVVSRPYCVECSLLATDIEVAPHSAGVQLCADPSFSGDVATVILVKLPTQDDLGTHPLVLALRKAGLNPVLAVHHIPQFSKIRTDIPVIFVGERFPEFLALPYWPDIRSGWTILPLAKQ